MSRYYGNILGNRGEATRQGTASSGFRASARSYIGSVTVRLWENDEGKRGRKDYRERDEITIDVGRGSMVGGREVFRSDLRSLVEAVEAGAVFQLVYPPDE